MKIAIIPNSDKEMAIEYANKILELLSEYECVFSVPEEFKKSVCGKDVCYYPTHLDAVANSDMVIAIGGDGTIIHTAKHAAVLNKAILGVNCGRVGFVANLEPSELSKLSNLFSGNYTLDNRMMLEVTISCHGKEERLYALNDVTISRGSLSRMVELNVILDNELINSYRSDGLIFSTPTGSTAYSLSAGGPVIEPHMKCILLTPICPHSLFSRSVLFSDDSEIKILPHDNCSEQIYVTVDGTHSFRIEANDSVIVKKSLISANFIKLNNKNFYRILSDKLNERRH